MAKDVSSANRGRLTLWSILPIFTTAVVASCLVGFVVSAQAEAIVVTSAADAGPGSLRAVIAAASDGETVTFDAGLEGQTISLTSGAVNIDKNLAIDGPGASELTIDAGHNSQIFTVSAGSPSIAGLTLTNGAAPEVGGAIEQTGTGSLSVSDCLFTGNTAGGAGGGADYSNLGHGGAIYVSSSSASTSVSGSTFHANAAGGPGGMGFQSGLGSGGAIWDAGESLTVSDSTFTDNMAGGNGDVGEQSGNGAGGAIQKSGGLSLTVSDSEFTGNTAGGDGGSGVRSGHSVGGAIYVSQPSSETTSLAVEDSSFSDNASGGAGGEGGSSGSGDGGAIQYFNEGPIAVSRTTFEGNSAGGVGGAGATAILLRSSGAGRGGAIFVGQSASSASVSGSVFIANTAGGDGGGGNLSGRGEGGAIDGDSGIGPMTIAESRFTDNSAGGREGNGGGSGAGVGGAIDSSDSLALIDSTFARNTAGGQGASGEGAFGFGGAVHNVDPIRPFTVYGSTFSGNAAGGQGGTGGGGAISASGSPRSVAISNSTLVGNTAGGGGAVGRGGAIEATDAAAVLLASATISGNEIGGGGSGAGINSTIGAVGHAATVTAKGTIISGNTGATNCDAPVSSTSYSLEGPLPGETSCGFDLDSANPELETLLDNGGPTETQALPVSSPAVSAVPAAQCPTSVDQRGDPRPDYGKSFCDAGAFELQGPLVAATIMSGAAASFRGGAESSFTVIAEGVPTPSISESGALPGGVAFRDNGDGTATLSGTPGAGTAGSYPLTIQASNGVSPDAQQSFMLIVGAPDGGPSSSAPGEPQSPPREPVGLSLKVQNESLRRLLRTGNFVVAARAGAAAKLTLIGRAWVNRRSPHKRLVEMLARKTVRFGGPGKRKVKLTLTREGREALGPLHRVRLVIAARMTGADGSAIRRAIGATLRN